MKFDILNSLKLKNIAYLGDPTYIECISLKTGKMKTEIIKFSKCQPRILKI